MFLDFLNIIIFKYLVIVLIQIFKKKKLKLKKFNFLMKKLYNYYEKLYNYEICYLYKNGNQLGNCGCSYLIIKLF